MIDANATMDSDQKFTSFLHSCDLDDLHSSNPAPSTYIGAMARRIDYIFGCHMTRDMLTRSGTPSHSEGPQSDHRGLYYVDLELGPFLNSSTETHIPPQSQKILQTGNPELVGLYHSRMLRYYEQHNMARRPYRQFAREQPFHVPRGSPNNFSGMG